MDFTVFAEAVQRRIEFLQEQGKLYRADTEKEMLWMTYLESFPEGSNPMFRERTEHDCNSCKSFIRQHGNLVLIKNGAVHTIWDIDLGDYESPYQIVAEALNKYVHSCDIRSVYRSDSTKLGVKETVSLRDDGKTERWNHFYGLVDKRYARRSSEQVAQHTTNRNVFHRGLEELSLEALDIVLDLIADKAIYRGEEFQRVVENFRQHKVAFEASGRSSLYSWEHVEDHPISFRNSAIGTLVVDLSEGMEIDKAVERFEAKVAPGSYKRTTAVVTTRMIEDARKQVALLGLTNALRRRMATLDDIDINDIIYTNITEERYKEDDPFVTMASEAPVKVSSKVSEVDIDTFLQDILPGATKVELLLENKHEGNLVSLVTGEEGGLFKWPNNFSWAYKGDVTDSIKERVKGAGGKVDGFIRCSLGWFNGDDLDLHLRKPNGQTVYFGSPRCSVTGINLDVDMNAGGVDNAVNPVENICFPRAPKARHGEYVVIVNQFTKRGNKNGGFTVEIEHGGEIHTFECSKILRTGENVEVARFVYDEKGFRITKSIPSTSASREIWGMTTNTFQEVSLVTLSPNHWDSPTGNKHYMFMLENAHNPDKVRGFFNEYLHPGLEKHRKVFEILGTKTMVDPSDTQLSGLGFSSTQRNSATFRVTGSFNRTIKVNF